MRKTLIAALPLAAAAAFMGAGRADTGVLIPWSISTEPDPDVLALRTMDVKVTVREGHAIVRIDQVFENRTGDVLEGKYVMPLGERATLSEFALWEGDTKRMGAIVDKQRGRQLYDQITQQEIDPGLMESGDEEEAAAGVFSLRVSPIPAYGTVRVQLAWEEELALSSLSSRFELPLKPRRYAEQPVGQLSITMDVRSSLPLADVRVTPAGWWKNAKLDKDRKHWHASLAKADVTLSEDVHVEWRLDAPPGGIAAAILGYRDVRPRADRSPFGGATYVDETGFFYARAVVGDAKPAAEAKPREVVLLVDTSLSMGWDKLDRALVAADELLGKRLGARDRFAVITFHDDVRVWKPELTPHASAAVADALAFVRKTPLAGGTDLAGALAQAGKLLAGARADAERFVVLVTDGHPTWGPLGVTPVAGAARAALSPAKARLFVLGVGDDLDGTLLRRLAAENDGAYAAISEGGDPTFTLGAFFDKLGKTAWDVSMTIPAELGARDVYPTTAATFDGADVSFYGRYTTPAPAAKVAFTARGGDRSVSTEVPSGLAAELTVHAWVARGWAGVRIRDLLDRIRTDGEREEWIAEIVALSKRYTIVTPYTSFIAAPRALLRPRNFQAGDPLLRVKTGPDVTAVTAIFPFGLTKALEYVPEEDVWETRFLAPVWMTDGTYECTLVLVDAAGRRERETKTFTVDSKPPSVDVELSAALVRAGDRVLVTARADQDTRTIRARVGDGPATDIRWSSAAKASIGELVIPADLPAGRHEVHVVAEDFAHNTSHASVFVMVVGE